MEIAVNMQRSASQGEEPRTELRLVACEQLSPRGDPNMRAIVLFDIVHSLPRPGFAS